MVVEGFGGCLPTEALAGATVERGSDRLDILRSTAERMFSSWIGSYGSLPGAAVVLREQVAGGEREVDTWQADTGA
ncbi:hypothetical protein ACIPSA_45170 [Streptomyces sp. NPDC086549]|uniref:hypothetical protein n=1 Tax=Streptomyces sp. NPDC086549 TaxID=3365752 RepID=UPI003801284F